MNRAKQVVWPARWLVGIVAAALFSPAAQGAPRLELQPGAHLCLIGNTLADRMQVDGWLETLLHARFPEHDLVIRNLGFSGDELTLRLRSAGFGTPDEHLSIHKADVVLAFFGYNESHAGEAGLDKFKQDLAQFVEHTTSQKYNGQSPPQLVLCSPIAHEDLGDRNLPDGRENNARLALYTAAMQAVAESKGCVFVDLLAPTRQLYADQTSPLTINGVHLNELGNRLVAEAIDRALFEGPAPRRDAARLAKLRAAVIDKNHHWYNRHRTVDGYSIFGGRADLKFVDGQTNRVVMQREMEVLDVMTAHRDARIWALARGGDQTVDDGNTPPFIPVKTNKPGAGPNGEHLYLGGVEAIEKMQAGPNLAVSLFASEEQFPELINPVQMAFDTRGRLWVAVWPTYPHWKPKEPMNDKLLILEDLDGDGRADRCKTFVDNLHNPTGFEFWNGGVLVAMAPELLFLRDTDGDDRADTRVAVLNGLDTADTHHAANSFTFDPAGALYFQEGTFHHTQVETAWGPAQRCANAGVFRYEPRAQKFEVYVTHGFANPHGHAFDRWGQDFVYDGTGANPYHAALFSGHLDFPHKHATPPTVYRQRTRPCPGVEILSSQHFPEENQGNLLVGNVIGVQGLLQYRLADDGASFSAEEIEPIVLSSDPNCRPSDFEIGPDGAIWFTDWQNPVIGHMQHNLRDPSRDKIHGRVYRVTHASRPLSKPPQIAGASLDKLLGLLKHPEDRVRSRVRIELSGRPSDEVLAAAKRWLASLDQKDAEFERWQLEGLWVHGQHNVVDLALLERVLASRDFRARAAAARLMCNWRDRVPSVLDRFKQLAADPHPRVRLEAVRAASFFPLAAAIEIPLLAAQHPSDKFLDFVRGETLKALEPYWKRALAEGGDLPDVDEASARVLLATVGTPDLLRAKRSRAVARELLERRGVAEAERRDAVERLARDEGKSTAAVMLASLRTVDQRGEEGVLFDLGRLVMSLAPADLLGVRAELESLSKSGKQAVTRQLACAALMSADGRVDAVWKQGLGGVSALVDVARSMPFVADVVLRTELVARVTPLLDGAPAELALGADVDAGVTGRYVRVELSGSRTLTLAEVEVMSDGENLARRGQATQKNTGHFGAAARGIDGNTSGLFSDKGQTHTQENTPDPWWEVDLGQEYPIHAIHVFNRTDGDLGARLDGYTLAVLDGQRRVVYRREQLPAPAPRATFDVGEGRPSDRLRRAAMGALVAAPGHEALAFAGVARFVREGVDLPAAMHALVAIPTRHWPADQAPTLLPRVLEYLRALPVADRTSPAALDAIQLGDALAALLPSDEARSTRRMLRELGVPVLRLATVPDRMLFDQDLLVVEAGKPLEIALENNDLMPHNFVLAQPGSLQAVGVLAESQATQPGALERNYVPASDQVLASSRLLAPRQSQRLKLTAPAAPGVYPYVCTYPGHWRRMYGAMYVVASLDDYQADPQAYLSAHPLEIADELLKTNRPRTEWKLADLEPLARELSGRSYDVGRQVFQTANCLACHKLGGVGQELGPDLARLDAKLTSVDILKHILEPSFKIDDKYRSYVFELNSGRTVTGLITRETPEAFFVAENPLLQAEATMIAKGDVENRAPSPLSLMPLGMVDRLSREEILDLVAYLTCRGDRHHSVFEGGHEHGQGH